MRDAVKGGRRDAAQAENEGAIFQGSGRRPKTRADRSYLGPDDVGSSFPAASRSRSHGSRRSGKPGYRPRPRGRRGSRSAAPGAVFIHSKIRERSSDLSQAVARIVTRGAGSRQLRKRSDEIRRFPGRPRLAPRSRAPARWLFKRPARRVSRLRFCIGLIGQAAGRPSASGKGSCGMWRIWSARRCSLQRSARS